jgi:hypothetical protein
MICTLLLLTLGLGVNEAHAHTPQHSHTHKHHRTAIPKRQKAPVITIRWTWVIGHYDSGKWIRGHWRHPNHGVSYRSRVTGPPPSRPVAHAHWVPGHWETRRRRDVWVPGHWTY